MPYITAQNNGVSRHNKISHSLKKGERRKEKGERRKEKGERRKVFMIFKIEKEGPLGNFRGGEMLTPLP